MVFVDQAGSHPTSASGMLGLRSPLPLPLFSLYRWKKTHTHTTEIQGSCVLFLVTQLAPGPVPNCRKVASGSPDYLCLHRKWEGGDPGVAHQKTPTCLLLTPEGIFHSFGYTARDYYHDLDPEEARDWLYFEKFKMKIHSATVSQCGQAPAREVVLVESRA